MFGGSLKGEVAASVDEARSQLAIHVMLDTLEDADPSMRMTCRSWLQDARSDYGRVLDPLFKELIANNDLY